MAYNVKDRVTTVVRMLNDAPIFFFPYCLVGKKGMVKAFYKGEIINVNYKESLKNCRGVNINHEYEKQKMITKQLEGMGIKTRGVCRTSHKLGITESLFVGRVSYN